ncbi:MAG: hypothetical protein ACFFD4_22240 [Candidatus Odinarchaeota archaeon]
MTLRKDYENDAWELLEDYFDKIRDSLLKASIKGETRQRVVTDLRSHVQMKADEIIARKDMVSYNDVLEIMAELGSPEEIASSYAQDLESVQVISTKDLYSPKNLVSEEVTEARETGKGETPFQGKVSPVYHDVKQVEPESNLFTVLKTGLITWRVFQVIVFTFPWFLLDHIVFRYIVSPYWTSSEYLTYLSFNTLQYIGFLYLLFVVVEHNVIRTVIIPRMGNFTGDQRTSTAVYRYGVFSTLVLPVALHAIVNVSAFLVSVILLVIVLSCEKTLGTDFAKHAEWKLKSGLQAYLEGNGKKARSFIFSFLMSSIAIYTVLITILTFQMPLSIGLAAFFGLFILGVSGYLFSVIILYLNIWFNSSNEQKTFKVYSIEISSIVWAFRWFVAIMFIMVMSTISIYTNILAWLFCAFIAGISLLFLERQFTNSVRKNTGLDYSLSKDVTKFLVKLNILPVVSTPVNPPPVSAGAEERPIPWKATTIKETEPYPVPSDKAKIIVNQAPVQTAAAIPSPHSTPAVEKNYQREFVSTKGIEPIASHPKSGEGSTFLSYAWDIIVLYLKVAIVGIFLLHFLVDVNYEPYGDRAIVVSALYTLLVLIISSYKLYSLSNKEYKVKPYYYWLLSFISWVMIFGVAWMIETFTVGSPYYIDIYSGEALTVILLFASPFILIQLASSKKLIFGRRISESEKNRISGIAAKKPS